MKAKFTAATIAAGIMWGIISIFLKGLTSAGFSQLQVLMFRSCIAALVMLIFILIKDPSLLKIRLKDLWIFLGSGVVSLTFFSLCYFKSISEIGAGTAVVLLYTSPIFVLLFSMIFFHEKLTWIKAAALVMTFAGCILVTGLGGKNAITAKGFLTGLASGIGYALYSIFGRAALKKYRQPTLLFYTFLFSGISIMPFCHVEQVPVLINLKTSALLAGIAVVCSVLPYAFYTYGLSGLETGMAAIFVTVEPLVGCLVGLLLWREPVSVSKIAGILIMLAAIVMLGLAGEKKNSDSSSGEVPASDQNSTPSL